MPALELIEVRLGVEVAVRVRVRSLGWSGDDSFIREVEFGVDSELE